MASIWSKIFPCSNLTSDFAGTRTTSLLELSNGEFIPKVVITSGDWVDEPICNLSELINSSN